MRKVVARQRSSVQLWQSRRLGGVLVEGRLRTRPWWSRIYLKVLTCALSLTCCRSRRLAVYVQSKSNKRQYLIHLIHRNWRKSTVQWSSIAFKSACRLLTVAVTRKEGRKEAPRSWSSTCTGSRSCTTYKTCNWVSLHKPISVNICITQQQTTKVTSRNQDSLRN